MIAECLSHGGVKGTKERQIQWAANRGFLLEAHLGLTGSKMVPMTGPEKTGGAERTGACLSQDIHNEWPDQHGGGGRVGGGMSLSRQNSILWKSTSPRILPWEESPEMIAENGCADTGQGNSEPCSLLVSFVDAGKAECSVLAWGGSGHQEPTQALYPPTGPAETSSSQLRREGEDLARGLQHSLP